MFEGLADWAIKFLAKKGCSYAEARLEHGISDAYAINNGIVETSAFDESSGLGLRFFYKNNMGFAAINKFDKKIIQQTIERSLKIVSSTKNIQSEVKLAEDKTYKAKYSAQQKIKLADIGAEEKINALLEIDKYVKDTKVKTTGRLFSIDTEVISKYFVNTEGSCITSIIPRISFDYYLTIAESGKTMQHEWMYGAAKGWEAWKEWDMKNKLASEAIALRNNMKSGVKPPSGKINVVVAPAITGIMVHESVGHPHEADRILGRESAQAGESYIKSKSQLGTRLGNNNITICEDPTIKGTYGFYLYDDEGVKARKRTIIKNGIINEFLHNRETAYQMGVKSNASARSEAFGFEPIVRMANSFVAPGEYKDEELIEDTKLGIYMKSFSEWNINDTRENQKYVGSECYLIKNGSLAGPVKKPIIEITTSHLWSSIDAVGKKIELHAAPCGKGEPMQTMAVTHGGPHMRIKGIKVR